MQNTTLNKWLNDHTPETDAKNNLYNIRLLQSFLKTQLHINITRFTYDGSFDRFMHTLISSRAFREADRMVGHRYSKALELYARFLKYSARSHKEIPDLTAVPISEENASEPATDIMSENGPKVKSALINENTPTEERYDSDHEEPLINVPIIDNSEDEDSQISISNEDTASDEETITNTTSEVQNVAEPYDSGNNVEADNTQSVAPSHSAGEQKPEQDSHNSDDTVISLPELDNTNTNDNMEVRVSDNAPTMLSTSKNNVTIENNDSLADELAAAAKEESVSTGENAFTKVQSRQRRTNSDTVRKSKKEEEKTPEELLRRSDYRQRPFNKTLEEMESEKELTNSIIQQIRTLKDAYGDSFPIGMIYITKEQYRKLLQVCNKFITERSDHSIISTAYISLTLVWTPVYSMRDHNFWTNYFKAVNVEDTYENRKYIQVALLKFCVNENLYFHYTAGQRQYVQTVFTHAVINKASLIADFDLVYSFFIEEMRETYDEKSVDNYIEEFAHAMINDLDSNSFADDSESVGIYRVDTAFKRAFKVFGSSMRVALKSMLYNVCSTHYRSNSYSTTPVSFFNHYKSWMIAKTIEKLKSKNETAPERNRISDNKPSKYFTKGTYLLEIDQSYSLYIPSQEIEADYSHLPIYLFVYSDDTRLDQYTQQLDVYGKFRFQTEPLQINFNRFESKLRYEIICDGDILYSSGTKMYREYIVFDSSFEEYTSAKLPQTHYYVLTHNESSWYADREYSSYPKFDYIIYSLEPDENQIVTCNDKLIFDNVISYSGIRLALPVKGICSDVKASVGMEHYEVYSQISYVDIHFHEIGESDLVFMCDDRIVDIAPLVIKRTETFVRIQINELFEEKAFRSLSVRKKGALKISDSKNIVFAKDMSFTMDKALYYNDRTALLEDIYADNISFDNIDFPYQYYFDKSLEMNIIGIADDVEISFSIKLPVIAWFYDDEINSLNGVRYFESSKLYYGNKLMVSAPFESFDVVAVNDSGFEMLECNGGYIDLIKYKTNSNQFTTIGIIDKTAKKEYPLFDLIHQPTIRDISVQIFDYGKRAIIDMSLLCGCSAEVRVTDKAGTEFFSESSIEEGSELSVVLPELAAGKYYLQIYMLQKDEFGFGTESQEIFKKGFVYGDVMEYLLKRRGQVQIKKCDIDGHGKYRSVENFYFENIRSEIFGLSYHADAFFYYFSRNSGEYVKKYFNGANPVYIRIIEQKENSISLVLTDNEYDGFLYEKNRSYLIYDTKNIKDSKNYEFPDHYIIDF